MERVPMLPVSGLPKWTALEIRQQYYARDRIRTELVGQLYSSIVCDEIADIIEESMKRFGYHPNWLAEKGLLGKWLTKDL